MRESLLKKKHGIPIALLLVLLFSGAALAWYCFDVVSSETIVVKPLSIASEEKFTVTQEDESVSDETSDLLEDDYSAEFDIPIPPIPENGTMCIVVITVENDATPGYNTVRLEPSQE